MIQTQADATLRAVRMSKPRVDQLPTPLHGRSPWLAVGLTAALSGCATATVPEGDGGLDGGETGECAPLGNTPVSANRYLYFVPGTSTWLASAAGTEPREICVAARPVVSVSGDRALCIPADPVSPLSLFDTGLLGVLASYPEWRPGTSGPALSADGTKVAHVAVRADGMSEVRVLDDGAHVIGSLVAADVLGFAGPQAVLITQADGTPGLWSILEAAARPIPGEAPVPVSLEPGGVIYRVPGGLGTAWLGIDGTTRTLGDGELVGLLGTRVLLRPVAEGAPLRLVDLLDPTFGLDVPVPAATASGEVAARLVGPDRVLFEERSLAGCNPGAVPPASRSVLFDALAGRGQALTPAGPLHRAQTDAAGRRALVLDTDVCGTPTGTGRIFELSTCATRELGEAFSEPVLGAALSPDGRFVAAALASATRVLDLDVAPPAIRDAQVGLAGASPLIFR